MPKSGNGPYTKNCKGCDQQFLARAKNQNFCSPKCAVYRKRALEQKLCETCGTQFYAGRSDHRVCGTKECLAKLQKARAFTWRLKAFGIDANWYERQFAEQNGVCAICSKPETHLHKGCLQNLSLDHDHKTMKVRGLLCKRCNMAIGLVDENIEVLASAIAYIKRFI